MASLDAAEAALRLAWGALPAGSGERRHLRGERVAVRGELGVGHRRERGAEALQEGVDALLDLWRLQHARLHREDQAAHAAPRRGGGARAWAQCVVVVGW